MSTTPTTVQEALDLAWKLASEAQEGQVNPEYMRYLEFHSLGLREYSARRNRRQARPLPTREEIASTIYRHSETLTETPGGPVTCESCATTIDRFDLDNDLSSHQADAVLALLKGQEA